MRAVNPDSSVAVPMSALGQKQTLQSVRPMSALPPKADIGTQPRDVRFVPKADIMRCSKTLFDYPSLIEAPERRTELALPALMELA